MNLFLQLFTYLLSFTFGVIVGWLTRGFLDRGEDEERYRDLIIIAVTLMWVASVFYDIVSPTYETSPLIHGLMGVIAGFFFKNKQPKGGKNAKKR